MSVVVGLGACSDDGEERVAPPTTTAPATTDEDQIRTVVEDWYEVRVRAVLDELDDQDDVDDYLTDEALDQFEEQIATREEQGIRTRRPESDPSSSEVTDVKVSDNTAVATECTVDPLIQYDESTGEVVNDDVLTIVRLLSMIQKEGRWLIKSVDVESEQEGVVSCSDA